jgi:hypothetical protein
MLSGSHQWCYSDMCGSNRHAGTSCVMLLAIPPCHLALCPLLQARSYDEATNTVLGWFLKNAQTRALSHPLPVMRAREVDRWGARLVCLGVHPWDHVT